MRWAIATSFVIHAFFIGLVFKGSGGEANVYPKVIPVRLTSMPAAKGTNKPSVPAETVSKSKKTEKIETPSNKTRMAEVSPRKKPKKAQPEPKPAVEETEPALDSDADRTKGLPEGVELGSEFGSARIDASGFDSPYYLNVLFSKIRGRWDNPYEGSDSVACVIYFVVDRRGKISDSAIEKSSGFPAYDQSALRAILAANPPPLPNQFASDELGIHLEFKYIPYN